MTESEELYQIPHHFLRHWKRLPRIEGVRRLGAKRFWASRSDALRVVVALDELHAEAIRQWRANQRAAVLALHRTRGKQGPDTFS